MPSRGRGRPPDVIYPFRDMVTGCCLSTGDVLMGGLVALPDGDVMVWTACGAMRASWSGPSLRRDGGASGDVGAAGRSAPRAHIVPVPRVIRVHGRGVSAGADGFSLTCLAVLKHSATPSLTCRCPAVPWRCISVCIVSGEYEPPLTQK